MPQLSGTCFNYTGHTNRGCAQARRELDSPGSSASICHNLLLLCIAAKIPAVCSSQGTNCDIIPSSPLL